MDFRMDSGMMESDLSMQVIAEHGPETNPNKDLKVEPPAFTPMCELAALLWHMPSTTFFASKKM